MMDRYVGPIEARKELALGDEEVVAETLGAILRERDAALVDRAWVPDWETLVFRLGVETLVVVTHSFPDDLEIAGRPAFLDEIGEELRTRLGKPKGPPWGRVPAGADART